MSSQSQAEILRNLRLERDRHVAFAFAAADLLIEVAGDGAVLAASGAAHAVLGMDARDIVGRPLAAFVAVNERPFIQQFLKQVHTLFRADPVVTTVTRNDGSSCSILLGGCRLPDRAGSAFLSVALVPDALTLTQRPRDEATGLLTPDALRTAAQHIPNGRSGGATQLQLIRLDGLSQAARQLPDGRSAMLMQEIGAALRASSIGGDAAGRLSDDSFGLVARPGGGPDHDALLVADITDAIRGSGIPDGQVAPHVSRIDIALAKLNSGDAGRVLGYAMSAFVKTIGTEFDLGSLQTRLTASVDEAASRFTATRQMLADERFTIVYQPVAHLASRVIHHYEASSRFANGADTYETVVFSEDVGLIIDLDLIVCRQVVKALDRAGDAKVAINLSGRSVQNSAFRSKLLRLVEQLGNGRNRLLFELTESAAVENTTEAAPFLQELRSLGHAVCLDDFGAGAAAYNYLRRFDVDFVKIDGPFLKSAGEGSRARALIRSICALCAEINSKVIGEMIEDEGAATAAAALGVHYGQGWLFGKPVPDLPSPVRPSRRKGGVETWE